MTDSRFKPVAAERLANCTVLLVGLGLIGGSVARGLRRSGSCERLLAYDTNQEQLQAALSAGDIDAIGTLEELVAQADLIVIALPTLATAALLPRLADLCGPQAIVTDVASVKGNVAQQLERLDLSFRSRCVLGHPLAGSEQSGYSASKADLFADRTVILTPLECTCASALRLVTELWRSLAANVLGMSVARHDEVLAATSHLPHLLAYSIVDVLKKQEQSEDIFRYAAGGFADFSRLASSDPQMWSEIFTANRQATSTILGSMIDELVLLKQQLDSSSQDELLKEFSQLFAAARDTREEFIHTHFRPNAKTTMKEKHVTFHACGLAASATRGLRGRVRVPGDKSISHRSIILGAIADGRTQVSGFLEGEDALNTLAAFRELGVTIVGPEDGQLEIVGVGIDGLSAPSKPLYMGNSGTAMRLMAGLLAAQPFASELTGDESLSKRPMARVADPLAAMGALIETQEGGRPPLKISPAALRGIEYVMPMASAQVKSCLLLAGIFAEGSTCIREPAVCRDHTERMLQGFAYPLERSSDGSHVCIEGGQRLKATKIDVPSDISSATFFLVAAAITPGSELELEHVGVNPSRIGIINLLKLMGADIEMHNTREVGGEPVADLRIRYAPLIGIEIPQEQIPLAIDEFPALFVAAALAQGETVLRGAEELRVKESDRLAAMGAGLEAIGVSCEMYPDGIRIQGQPEAVFTPAVIDSEGDHRIAMAFAVASLRASAPLQIENCANVATSFPNFVELSRQLGLEIRVEQQ